MALAIRDSRLTCGAIGCKSSASVHSSPGATPLSRIYPFVRLMCSVSVSGLRHALLRYKVLKQVHSDQNIDAKAMAVANDYLSDLLARLVGKAAALTEESVTLDGDWERLAELGSGFSDFELVRSSLVVRTPVSCSGAGDDQVEASLLISSPDVVRQWEIRMLPVESLRHIACCTYAD